jgi:hypothetical protein
MANGCASGGNHPSVVIWDAQNETITPETGTAISAVRGLDLSGRPWDNGWSPPQAPGDSLEQHIYHFSPWRSFDRFTLSDLARTERVPRSNEHKANDGRHAVIINEYAWLWLNRDGSAHDADERFSIIMHSANRRARRSDDISTPRILPLKRNSGAVTGGGRADALLQSGLLTRRWADERQLGGCDEVALGA